MINSNSEIQSVRLSITNLIKMLLHRRPIIFLFAILITFIQNPSLLAAKNKISPFSSNDHEYINLKLKCYFSSYESYEILRKNIENKLSLDNCRMFFACISRNSNEYSWMISEFTGFESSPDKKLYNKFISISGNPDILLSFLNSALPKIFRKAKTNEAQRSNIFAWGWGYLAEACVLAYHRTSDERFLLTLIESFDEIIKYRDTNTNKFDNYHKKIMRSWGSGVHKKGSSGGSVLRA